MQEVSHPARKEAGAPAAPSGFPGPGTDAVVKVFATHSYPNYALPWTTLGQSTSTSTGFAIQGPEGQRWILTNAHSVEHHAVVQVRRRGGEEKFVAEVLCEGPDCDLALLRVPDDRFWEGVEPLAFSETPLRLREEVMTLGYPVGGDSFCVTRGVVSRMDLTDYAHGAQSLLAVQTDAAINAGNSGGPVVRTDDALCIGIAFQKLEDEASDNIGYVIPAEIAKHFLQQYTRSGKYIGFGSLGVSYQPLENPTLRAALKMPEGSRGVRVSKIDKTAPSFHVLREGDIISNVMGKSIANDGTVPYLDGERINFVHEIRSRFVGEKIALDIVRDGEAKTVEVETAILEKLVPYRAPRRPEYLIVGGIVFVPLTVSFLENEYGDDYQTEGPVRLIHHLQLGESERKGQQVVLVAHVLAHPLTIGYSESSAWNTPLARFNGQEVHSLKDLAQQVAACEDEYLRFELVNSAHLILNREEAEAALPGILESNMIASAMSEGLRD